MGYDQGIFRDPELVPALCLETVAPCDRIVTSEMASAVEPCETAGCVAAHAYVCSRGWQEYLAAAVDEDGELMAPYVASTAASDLGMSGEQLAALFSEGPGLHHVSDAFHVLPEDWNCPETRIDEIEERWKNHDYRADDMATVLYTLARRCDRVNAFVAAIDNRPPARTLAETH